MEPGKYISGHCIMEREVRQGIVKTRQDPESFHRRCRGGVCTCPHHSDNEENCKFCGILVTGSDQCTDREACEERLAKKLEGQKRAEELSHVVNMSKERANAEKRESRPKGSGVCEHCGEPTSGGKFRMGHDMKLKGEMFRAVRGHLTGTNDVGVQQAVDTMAELMLRGWVPKDLDQATEAKPTALWQKAEKIYKDKTGRDAWLALRVKERIDGDG